VLKESSNPKDSNTLPASSKPKGDDTLKESNKPKGSEPAAETDHILARLEQAQVRTKANKTAPRPMYAATLFLLVLVLVLVLVSWLRTGHWCSCVPCLRGAIQCIASPWPTEPHSADPYTGMPTMLSRCKASQTHQSFLQNSRARCETWVRWLPHAKWSDIPYWVFMSTVGNPALLQKQLSIDLLLIVLFFSKKKQPVTHTAFGFVRHVYIEVPTHIV
jgi:hypothetical protein